MAGGGGPVPIILHLNQFLLALITVIMLHITGQSYDFEQSLDHQKERDKMYEGPPKYTDEMIMKEEEYFPYPSLHFTGAAWAVVVGLLGLLALVVLILSFVFNFPKLMKWYYLIAAILIIFFACLGLGYNRGVVQYGKCVDVTEEEEMEWKAGKPGWKEEDLTEWKDNFGSSKCVAKYFSDFGKDERKKEPSYIGGAVWRVFIFGFSFLHSMLYLTSFLLMFFDGSSSSGGGGRDADQQSREQAAREQQARDQQIKDQQAVQEKKSAAASQA